MDELEYVARKICIKRDIQFVKREGQGAFKQTFQAVDFRSVPQAVKLYKVATALDAMRDRSAL